MRRDDIRDRDRDADRDTKRDARRDEERDAAALLEQQHSVFSPHALHAPRMSPPASGSKHGKKRHAMSSTEMEQELELNAIVVDKLEQDRFKAKTQLAKKRQQLTEARERLKSEHAQLRELQQQQEAVDGYKRRLGETSTKLQAKKEKLKRVQDRLKVELRRNRKLEVAHEKAMMELASIHNTYKFKIARMGLGKWEYPDQVEDGSQKMEIGDRKLKMANGKVEALQRKLDLEGSKIRSLQEENAAYVQVEALQVRQLQEATDGLGAAKEELGGLKEALAMGAADCPKCRVWKRKYHAIQSDHAVVVRAKSQKENAERDLSRAADAVQEWKRRAEMNDSYLSFVLQRTKAGRDTGLPSLDEYVTAIGSALPPYASGQMRAGAVDLQRRHLQEREPGGWT